MGRVYTNTGNYARADSLLRSALRLRRSQDAGASVAQAQTRRALAYSLFRQGHFEKAEQLYRNVLDTYRHHDDIGLSQRASALNGLALLLDERGRPAQADSIYRRIIDLYRAKRDSVPGIYFHNRAIALERQNRFKRALRVHRTAIATLRAQHGRDHPTVANAIARLAFTYQRAGQLEKAEPLHRKALQMRRKLLPPDHPHLA
jgi:tetratricopeptide (TPR) repeat protein